MVMLSELVRRGKVGVEISPGGLIFRHSYSSKVLCPIPIILEHVRGQRRTARLNRPLHTFPQHHECHGRGGHWLVTMVDCR